MGHTPDAATVVAAVADLYEVVRAVFDGPHPPADDAAAWARLAGQAEQIDTRARWCRDATLTLARRAGATWAVLERETGVADSTLDDRLRVFLRAEGKPA